MSKTLAVTVHEESDKHYLVEVPDWFDPDDPDHCELLIENDLHTEICYDSSNDVEEVKDATTLAKEEVVKFEAFATTLDFTDLENPDE